VDVVRTHERKLQEILVELGESGGRTSDASPLKKFPRRAASLRPRNQQLTHNIPDTMRPLTEPETKTLFEKLATYCGKGISNLIADPSGGNDRNVFRVQVRTFPILFPQFQSVYLQLHRAQESTTSANRSPTSPPLSRATNSSPWACVSGNSPKPGNSGCTSPRCR
jgi:hypothetical protein